MEYDSVTYYPLGAASYYFKEDLISFIANRCSRSQIICHIGAQPNSNPHIGNVVTFATVFALASARKKKITRKIVVKFIFVETAPSAGRGITIDGVRFQKSLAETGVFDLHHSTFRTILESLSSLSNVLFEIETQDFWRKSPSFMPLLREITSQHSFYGACLSPETKRLGLRAPCSTCGLADKSGVKNCYCSDSIFFTYPLHGEFRINLCSSDQVERLEMNTPLRNLVRVLSCSKDQKALWILCTGADYAGFYQEQLCYRLVEHQSQLPMIFYAPLILDWSGSKLSKSLYIEEGAYAYLCKSGLEYMLDANVLLRTGCGIDALFAEV